MKDDVKRILLIILMTFFVGVAAGEERLHFNNMSTDKGLSNKMVLSVAQDRDGFMWFGTAEGLDRYDGTEVRVFKHIPGDESTLNSSWVNCVYVTMDGRILVGTEMGLDEYDPETESFIHVTPGNDKKGVLGSLRIKCLYDDDEYIYAGTSEGLARISKRDGNMQISRLIPAAEGDMKNEVKAILRDVRGRLWAGTFDGLFLFDSDNAPVRRFDVRKRLAYDQKNNYISSLYSHPSDTSHLFVGTSNGLCVMDLRDFSFTYFRTENSSICDNDVKCIGTYGESTLLVGTSDGLSALDLDTYSFTNYTSSLVDRTSLPHETVWSIISDNLGVLWLGTGDGVSKAARNHRSVDMYRMVAEENGRFRDVMVNDLVVTPWDEIWVGTNSVIQVYDSSMNLLRSYSMLYSGLPHNIVKRLIVDSRGIIWVGTNDGLVYFDKLSDRFVRVNPDAGNVMLKYVYDVKETGLGEIAVNISSGICLVSPQVDAEGRIEKCTFRVVRISSLVSSNATDVTYMYADKTGRIWFGTINDGLFSYDGNEITQYRFDSSDPSSINSNRIYTICVDDKGAVWVGTDMGLCRLDRNTGKFLRFNADVDLSSSIRTLTCDSRGRLWICTLNKVIMYDYEYDNKIICDVGSDLDCREIAYNSFSSSADGELYIGGYGGVLRIQPSSVKINMSKSPVRLTSFSLKEEPVVPGEIISGREILSESITKTGKIVLDHTHNSFTIKFALMNYLSEANNKYSYILHGYDKEWTNVDGLHASATYSGIPAGSYCFEVKGANPDNIFTDESASVDIRVLSPIWLRWWAICLYVLVGTVVLIVLLRMAFTMLRLKSELKFEKIQRTMMESLNKVKMNFFTNISHEFKTPLSLIIGPLDNMLESEVDDKSRKQMLIMKQNANRMLHLINQILDLKKIDSDRQEPDMSFGEIVSFSRSVAETFRDNAQRRDISFEFIADGEINCPFDSDKLEKILYNLLSNAFKFTPDGGSVQLVIKLKEEKDGRRVEFCVEDSGEGISDKDIAHIFERFYQGDAKCYEKVSSTGIGLGLTKEFVELQGGRISVDSALGKGRRFTFYIPCGNDASVSEDVSDNFAGIDGQRWSIVVIDDNPDMLSFLKLSLEDEYDVKTADSGLAGADIVEKICPDVVISDVMMPDIDGYEVCRRVKNNPATSHIPVILLTAKDSDDSKEEGYRCGADGYVTKPFTVKVLKARIESLAEIRERLKMAYRGRVDVTSDSSEPKSFDDKFMDEIIRTIGQNLSNSDFSVHDLCEQTAYSYLQIYRKVRALTGETVNELIRNIRLQKAASMLTDTDLRISEIMYDVGFSSHSYFTKCFKERFGVSPKEYALKNRK